MKYKFAYYFVAAAASVFLLFQNCAPVTFTAAPLELASKSEILTCDSTLQPSSSETINCPNGSTGSGATRTRSVTCDNTTWIASAWSNYNYSSCTCSITGQTVNPLSGVCECSTGKTVVNGQCVVPTCDLNTQPSSLETGSCPSGIGSSRRTRTVTCDMASTSWSTSSWSSWDYSQCSCPVAGEIVNSATGACNCPSGQVVLNNMCQAPTCDPAVKPVSSEAVSCPSGSGTASRTRTVTCPSGSTTWSASGWSYNYSACTCTVAGQTLNSATGTCSCPSGQEVISGKCQVPTCDSATKPATTQNLTCPSGSGTAYQSRSVTCSGTTWVTGSWTANYSSCNCPAAGQTLNTSTGTCSCPSGQTVINGACKTPSCDPATEGALTQTGLTCPNNLSGTYSQSRTASCNTSNYTWSYSSWTPNYSTCSCSISGQTFTTSSLTCACPSGQVVNSSGTACETPTCNSATKPATTDYTSCPSGSGTATRNRSVSCSGTTWISGTWGSWNYSGCSCSVINAVVNPSTGSCSCTNGTYQIGNYCGTCASDETYNASNMSCVKNTCQNPDTGAAVAIGGTYSYFTTNLAASQTACNSAKVTVTCQSNGQWSGAIPSNHYGSCTVATCANPDTGAAMPVGSTYSAYTVSTAASQAACDGSRVTLTCQSNGQWNAGVPYPRYGSCTVNACPSSLVINWAGYNSAAYNSPGEGVLPNGDPWCYYEVWHDGDLFCASVDKYTGQKFREGKCCGGYGTDKYMTAKYGTDCKAFWPCNSGGAYMNQGCNYGLQQVNTQMDPTGAYPVKYECRGAPGDNFQCDGYPPPDPNCCSSGY